MDNRAGSKNSYQAILSPVQQSIEKAKDFVEQLAILTESKIVLQNLLFQIRLNASLLERRLLECEMRQSVYAEVAEKILDRAILSRDA